MKYVIYLFSSLLLFVATSSEAANSVSNLNDITYHIQEKQWAVTNKANVVISLDATVAGDQVEAVQQRMRQKLESLEKSVKWNVLQLNRTQDASGLEKLNMIVSARLPSLALNNFRQRVKKLSVPGEIFSVQTINFQPTLQDIETTRSQLRDKIYRAVKIELARLNKLYPKQHYFLHTLDFAGQGFYPLARTALLKTPNVAPSSINVKTAVVVNATVTLSSQIK